MASTTQNTSEWLNALSRVVEAARRKAGARDLDEGALAAEVEDWAHVCEPIPLAMIDEAYYHALRERTVRSLMQPGELYQAYLSIRERQRGRAQSWEPLKANEPPCFYCDDCGWQTIMQRSNAGVLNSSVRPCACSAAPSSMRSAEPKREPQFVRDVVGRWWKPEDAAGQDGALFRSLR